jgi:hypothetical protein
MPESLLTATRRGVRTLWTAITLGLLTLAALWLAFQALRGVVWLVRAAGANI